MRTQLKTNNNLTYYKNDDIVGYVLDVVRGIKLSPTKFSGYVVGKTAYYLDKENISSEYQSDKGYIHPRDIDVFYIDKLLAQPISLIKNETISLDKFPIRKYLLKLKNNKTEDLSVLVFINNKLLKDINLEARHVDSPDQDIVLSNNEDTVSITISGEGVTISSYGDIVSVLVAFVRSNKEISNLQLLSEKEKYVDNKIPTVPYGEKYGDHIDAFVDTMWGDQNKVEQRRQQKEKDATVQEELNRLSKLLGTTPEKEEHNADRPVTPLFVKENNHTIYSTQLSIDGVLKNITNLYLNFTDRIYSVAYGMDVISNVEMDHIRKSIYDNMCYLKDLVEKQYREELHSSHSVFRHGREMGKILIGNLLDNIFNFNVGSSAYSEDLGDHQSSKVMIPSLSIYIGDLNYDITSEVYAKLVSLKEVSGFSDYINIFKQQAPLEYSFPAIETVESFSAEGTNSLKELNVRFYYDDKTTANEITIKQKVVPIYDLLIGKYNLYNDMGYYITDNEGKTYNISESKHPFDLQTPYLDHLKKEVFVNDILLFPDKLLGVVSYHKGQFFAYIYSDISSLEKNPELALSIDAKGVDLIKNGRVEEHYSTSHYVKLLDNNRFVVLDRSEFLSQSFLSRTNYINRMVSTLDY